VAHPTHYTGKAGEYAVASQLLLRGITVHFPAVDDGVDLIAGGRVRIQVKAAHKLQGSKRSRCKTLGYTFNVGSTIWNAKEKTFTKPKRNWAGVVDFFVFWGIEEDRFWVVPSHLLCDVRMLRLGLDDKATRLFSVKPDEVRALLGTGLQQRQIAQRLGISETSVSRVVNGWTSVTKPGACYEANRREDAWHEIISAVGLVNAVDGLAPLKTNQEVSI